MLMRRFAQLALVAGLAIASATSANASLSQSFGTIPTQAIGDLPITVGISYVTHGTATLNLVNPTSVIKNYTNAAVNIPLTVSGPDGLTATGMLAAGPFTGTVPAHGSVLLSGSITTNGLSSTLTSGLSPYIGNGITDATFTFDTPGLGVSGVFGTKLQVTPDGTAGADITVTYVYEPSTTVIPEPATIVGLASGLVCLGLVRLRRKTA
jgi:hypothetical protein